MEIVISASLDGNDDNDFIRTVVIILVTRNIMRKVNILSMQFTTKS